MIADKAFTAAGVDAIVCLLIQSSLEASMGRISRPVVEKGTGTSATKIFCFGTMERL